MPSEFALIERHFTRPVRHSVLGVGDDGAIVKPGAGMELIVSTDMLVAGTHFFADTDPTDLGWKTLAVNLSDLAAMGAQPRWAVLAAALPAERAADDAWITAFAKGFFACADAHDVDVVGGDTTRGPLNFCVTVFGEAPAGKALLRSGARPGDEIWVSGAPGRAALGLAHLQGRCRLDEPARSDCLNALQHPQPRVRLGTVLSGRHLASTAIDISDGLLADLSHILDRSGVAATLHLARFPDATLRCGVAEALAQDCLLAGGDDYELLFTAAADKHAAIAALATKLDLPLHCIGHIEAGTPKSIKIIDPSGKSIENARYGYDHFI